MLTKGGIEFDLNESPFYYTLEGLTFYFSSNFYKNKFMENCLSYARCENTKILSKYKVYINMKIFLLISFYAKIEKRGFRIHDNVNNKEITSITEIQMINCFYK